MLRRASNLPAEAKGATFSTLTPYPWLVPALAAAQEVTARPVPNWWYTLSGAYGIGKTAVIYAMLNACLERNLKVCYFRAFDAMQYIKSGIADGTIDARIEEMKTVGVLALDEVGYDATDYDKKVLTEILGERYARGRACLTVMAYNPPLQLPALVLSRINDGRSRAFKLEGRDLRPLIKG